MPRDIAQRRAVMVVGLLLTLTVALWGLLDAEALGQFAARRVDLAFESRGWFVMLLISGLLFAAFALAFSRYGQLRLGPDDAVPEFTTISWLSMLFAAGMGVGLLYWGAAEPLSHFLVTTDYQPPAQAATSALLATHFHWGFHAWAIFAITGLVIAYFRYRRLQPQLPSAAINYVFGARRWSHWLGPLVDILSVYAVAIGVAGTIGMGVFQLRDGVALLGGLDGVDPRLTWGLFAGLCVGFALPLLVDLGQGMARLSNLAIALAIALCVFVLLTGPTHYLMNGIVEGIGEYLVNVIPQGFRTFTFFDERIHRWYQDWTLTYMIWWISWAPFVGVFIARISRGRTIREFILAVVLVPSLFSIFWFGVFGGQGFFQSLHGDGQLLSTVRDAIDQTTYVLLSKLPLAWLTQGTLILAALLFVITSVVSATLVLATFASGGHDDPGPRLKLMWASILAALGAVMILMDNIETVRTVIAMSALPYTFILPLLLVCLLRALRADEPLGETTP